MNVPFHRASISDAEINEVTDTLKSGWLTTGQRTKEFEEAFAEYVGARHAIALNSCTSALHLALEACGINDGDTVLVPTMTFAATAEVVRYLNAKPLFVDCDPDTRNLCLDSLEEVYRKAIAANEKVTAVMPVHYGGMIAPMVGVHRFAEKNSLKVIEDSAHCCPAWRIDDDGNRIPTGKGSDVCCYSFYANKCITTGEGGMATTDDDDLAARMRLMSLHGMSRDAWKRFSSDGNPEYLITAPGFKYNLTDIASSIGLHQLKDADKFREQREQVAKWYDEALAGLDDVIIPEVPDNRISSFHLYVIRLPKSTGVPYRRQIAEALKERGIVTSLHWRPLHMHPYYVETYSYKPDDFPVAARQYEEIISLPIFPSMTQDQVKYVADSLKAVLAES